MAPHSSTVAWKIPWMEEPGRLQSMGSRRVGHDWAASLSLFTFMHWRRKWQPTPVFLPGESQGQRSLVGYRLWGHTESDCVTTKHSSLKDIKKKKKDIKRELSKVWKSCFISIKAWNWLTSSWKTEIQRIVIFPEIFKRWKQYEKWKQYQVLLTLKEISQVGSGDGTFAALGEDIWQNLSKYEMHHSFFWLCWVFTAAQAFL